jgi:hypothetical protein
MTRKAPTKTHCQMVDEWKPEPERAIKAGSTARAALEDLGNKEWRFVEIPYEVEMKFNDLLDAKNYGSVTAADMERQLRELLCEGPNFIDVYHHLAMLLEKRGKGQEAQLLWAQTLTCWLYRSGLAGACPPLRCETASRFLP